MIRASCLVNRCNVDSMRVSLVLLYNLASTRCLEYSCLTIEYSVVCCGLVHAIAVKQLQ